jgi:RNA polymerase sigma factor (TIGR02999 family)
MTTESPVQLAINTIRTLSNRIINGRETCQFNSGKFAFWSRLLAATMRASPGASGRRRPVHSVSLAITSGYLRAGLYLAFQLMPLYNVGVMPETAEITQVLHAIGRSEEGASEKLLPLVYADLRRLAAARMAQELSGQTLQPTALVHEAWLRLVNDGDRTWQNRAHFFGAAAEAMRRILIERARHKSRLKHGGGQARLNIEDLELAQTTPDDKVLLVDEALALLKEEDPELERIVVLKFFGGLSNEEIAETLGLAPRTLDRQWAYARAWLFRYISEQK